MRGCLGFLAVVAIAGAGLAWALVTLLLPAVVSAGVRDSPFLRGQTVQVDVQTSFAGVFLHGTIDRITVSAHGLSEPSASVAAADIVLSDVSIVDRSFSGAAGTLAGVTIDVAPSGALPLGVVTLSGPSQSLTAVADMDAATASAALRVRFAAAGLRVDTLRLAAGRIDLTIAGTTIAAVPVITATEVRLEANGGAISQPILTLPAGGEWRITGIEVSPAGILVTALVNLD